MRPVIIVGALALFTSCKKEKPVNVGADRFNQFLETFNESPSQPFSVPDLSAEYYAQQVKETKEELATLLAVDTGQLDFEDKMDWRFAHSILKGRELRREHHQSWKRDAREYMTFRKLGTILDKPGEVDKKVGELTQLLRMLPTQLENGKKQLTFYVPRFQELSLYMASNAKGLFSEALPHFAKQHQQEAQLLPLIKEAEKALDAFIVFLRDELPKRTPASFELGEETYDALLEHEFLLDHSSKSLWAYGKMRFDETVAELVALAKQIDSTKSWQELATAIKNEYPEAHDMIAAHQLWVDNSRSHILKHHLMPIPWKEEVKVVPRAEYLRKTSYYGNFSRATGMDDQGVFTAQWMINPFEEEWDDTTKQEYLNEHDWGVIIVTAPHESYGGHHVQGLYQLHNPRKIRRQNGISLFSEGWGLYNEQLMAETGFLPNDSIRLRQLQLRLWRNARVVYDVGMHSGRMGYEEAIAMMTDEVGFLPWAAQLEIDSATERPGYFIGYYMGMSEILRIRERYKTKMGDTFSLGDFHEKLLKIGNMPPKLMEESLFAD